jgi:transcriptional regulator with XRE-family HTH domain
MTFGENVRALRQRAGFKTSKSLADALGVFPSVVSRWENDLTGPPEAPTLFKLSNMLGCSVEELIKGINPEYDAKLETRHAGTEEFLQRALDRVLQEPDPTERARLTTGLRVAFWRGRPRAELENLLQRPTSVDVDLGSVPSEADRDALGVTNNVRHEIPLIQEGEASPTAPNSHNDARPDSEKAHTLDRETDRYAVVLRSDSMEPLLKRGMRLIVSVTQPVADGDLAYVQLKSGERFARIAAHQDGGWLFSCANPAYAPRFVPNDQIEIIHEVVYVRFLRLDVEGHGVVSNDA